jgi:hypothetical protein
MLQYFLWKLTLTGFVSYPVDCFQSLVSCKRVAETSLSKLHLRAAFSNRASWAHNATAICVRIAPMKACGCIRAASTGNWSHHPATSRIRVMDPVLGNWGGSFLGVPPPAATVPKTS